MKLNESLLRLILDIVFEEKIDEIIRSQEYIGIRLSGGIDSAFLCYLTMSKYPNTKIIPITMYNKIRPDAAVSVKNVIQKLKQLNPNSILLEQEIGYFDTTGFERTAKMQERFEKTGEKYNPKDVFQNWWFNSLFDKYEGKLNAFFSGETQNPPTYVQKKFGLDKEFPVDRNKNVNKLIGIYKYNGRERYEFKAFRNRNKKEIANWVKDLGLFETLFPVTETCELEIPNYAKYSKKFNIEYKNPGVEPCRRCWPCREKWWAYGYYDFMTEEK